MNLRSLLAFTSLLAIVSVDSTARQLPSPLSVCVERATDTKDQCLKKKRFDEGTCKVHYEQSVKICYDRYKQ
jgi:hypothetical protein